jgi:hypothetical protein
MSGPFESEHEAGEAAHAMQAQYLTNPAIAPGAETNRMMLLDTINAAGVQLGEYDREVIGWLAGQEPETCVVIAGLISRASEPRR